VRRMTGRRTCSRCGRPYHVTFNPPKADGVCDVCGGGLEQRPDDREETVRERLRIYHQCTMQILPYYREQGLLREVPGTGAIEEIHSNIVQQLRQADS